MPFVDSSPPSVTRSHMKAESMSRRNGDRARFQKERKRKMLRRQRVQAFIKAGAPESPQSPDAPKAAAKA
jgi:hypothetical protein